MKHVWNKLKTLISNWLSQHNTSLKSKPNSITLKTSFGKAHHLKLLALFLCVPLTACQTVQVRPTVPHPEIHCDVSGQSVDDTCVAIILERYISALNKANGG